MTDAKQSGLLKGSGGPHRFGWKPKPTLQFPDISLGEDPGVLREHIPDYVPELEYTERELVLLAEKFLLMDEKPWNEHPMILSASRYKYRLKHEIYCANGQPDPSIEQGLYWRTHPSGRRFRSDKQQRQASGFYRP